MARKISVSSQTVASSSLHLNRLPGTQIQIISTRYQGVAPLSDLNQRQLRFEGDANPSLSILEDL
jgi:hypothetical protein